MRTRGMQPRESVVMVVASLEKRRVKKERKGRGQKKKRGDGFMLS